MNKIGTDYFIRCRPLSDLTKTIQHEGKKVIPIVEMAKLEHAPNKIEEIFNIHSSTDGKTLWVDYLCEEFQQNIRFCFCIDSFQKGYIEDMSHFIVKRQPELFSLLYSLHFKPSQIPEEWVKWID